MIILREILGMFLRKFKWKEKMGIERKLDY